MNNNLEQDCFFEIEDDKTSDVQDIQEKKTDEEMSFNSLETKRKTLSIHAPSAVWQHFEKIFDNGGIHLQSQ